MFKNEKVVLMPFCVESVFLYHKLKRKGIDVLCFFDNKNQYRGSGGIAVLIF